MIGQPGKPIAEGTQLLLNSTCHCLGWRLNDIGKQICQTTELFCKIQLRTVQPQAFKQAYITQCTPAYLSITGNVQQIVKHALRATYWLEEFIQPKPSAPVDENSL